MENKKENWSMYKTNIAKILGINCAIFLNVLEYYNNKTEDGWIYRTVEQIEEYTALTKRQQTYVKNQLMKLNILEIKKVGYPAKNFYKINENILNDYISGNKMLPQQNVTTTKRNNNRNDNIEANVISGNNLLLLQNVVTTKCSSNKMLQQQNVTATERDNYKNSNIEADVISSDNLLLQQNVATTKSYDNKMLPLTTELVESIQELNNVEANPVSGNNLLQQQNVVATKSNHGGNILLPKSSPFVTTETSLETASELSKEAENSLYNHNNNQIYNINNNINNIVVKKEENLDEEFFTTMVVKRKANDVYSFFTTYVEIWSQKYKDFNKPILTPKIAKIIKNILKIEKDKDKLYNALKAFISSNDSYIINRLHDLSLFLNDINKWIALSINPELAKKFTQEYCKARMYEEAKEIAKKDFEKESNKRIQEEILEDMKKRRIK